MQIQHISINRGSALGGRLYSAVDKLQSALVELNELKDCMPYMVDGEPEGEDTGFEYLETQFGLQVGKGALAKGEIESLMAKLNTNASVSDVQAALTQVFNYFA